MFAKECRAITKSIVYFAFLIAVLLFYVTQLGDFAGNDIRDFATGYVRFHHNPLIVPVPGQENYGFRQAEIPEQVMPNAIARLAVEYSGNMFPSYATGFIRNIRLNNRQLGEIHSFIVSATGLNPDEILRRHQDKITMSQTGGNTIFMNEMDFSDVIPIIIEYDGFRQVMGQIDDMIGGGSSFDPLTLSRFGMAAITFEERLAQYEDFLNIDRITGSYARLFSDYMGIVIALFSVFVPVAFLLRDRRAKMDELIFSRAKSSVRIVLTRYFALVCMTVLPFYLLSLLPTVQLSVFAAQNGLSVDYFAFAKYITAWLLPTVLTATSVAFLLTILTNTPIAIILQFVWGIFGVFTATNIEGGYYGFEMAIRHNSLENLHLMQEHFNALLINRLSYVAVSVVLIVISVYVFNLKRRGRLYAFGNFKKAVQKATRNR